MSGHWNIQLLNCFLTILNFDLSFCSTNTAVNSLSLVVENCSSLLLPQIPPTREKIKQPTHPLKRLGVRKYLQNLCFTADSVVLLSEMSHHQTIDAKKEPIHPPGHGTAAAAVIDANAEQDTCTAASVCLSTDETIISQAAGSANSWLNFLYW